MKNTREKNDKDSKELIQHALKLGVNDVRIIDASDISVEERLSKICEEPGCTGYGKGLNCPPHAMKPHEFQNLLNRRKKAIIFKFDVPTSILLSDERIEAMGLVHETAADIVHMATHGVFGETPEETFLLTYDDRLTMDILEILIGLGKFRGKKVELLTLSACQTALGDERAAPGLGGAAVKAGVGSVLATLWYVNDESTSLAVREFYRQLKIPGISKAKALQNAQKKLIEKDRYWHPVYWAPFLLIGNWM